MSQLDGIDPELSAVLSLLVRQRKSYAALAALLGIEERAVHDRAHAALALLAPRQARALEAAARQDVGDYMLGQQSAPKRAATRSYLASSAPARAWARAIGAELAPLSTGELPEIPDQSLPSSRRAGALLLATVAVVVVVAVVLILNAGGGGGGGGGGGKSAGQSTDGTASSSTSTTSARTSSAATNATGATGATGAGKFHLDKELILTSPEPAGKALGRVYVISEGGKRGFYIIGEHLPPSKGFFYVAWLYNSQASSKALGRSPTVGSNGVLQGGGLLPSNAGSYHEVIVTRETSAQASQPGPIVLSGPFSLH